MIKPRFKKSYTLIAGTGIILAILAVVIFFAVKSHSEFKRAVIAKTQDQLLTIAKSVADSIYHNITMLSDNLDAIAQNEEIQRSLKYINWDNPRFSGALPDTVYNAHQSNVEAVYILDAAGRVVHRSPEWKFPAAPHSVAHKPDVAFVLEGRLPYISKPFYSGEGVFVIGILKPIFYRGEFVGIARFLVKIDTLADNFLNHVKVGERGYAQMIDRSGVLLAIPDSGQVGRHIMEKPKQLFPGRDWSPFESFVQEMTAGGEGSGIADVVCWFNDDHKNQIVSKLFAYAQAGLGANTWSVIISIDYDEVAAAINTNTRSSILFSFIIIAIVLLAGYYIFGKHKELIRLENEKKFRILFETMHEGVMLCELISDDAGKAIDYRIADVNPSFGKHTGLDPASYRGMPASQFFRCAVPPYIREFEQVALTGVTIYFDTYFEPLKRHLSISAAALTKGFFSVVFEDISERKLADETLQRYSAELEKSNKELQAAIANVKQLSEMLPICSYCKKIRNDKGYWEQIESYITKHTDTLFSHGMCPECENKAYAELEGFMKGEEKSSEDNKQTEKRKDG